MLHIAIVLFVFAAIMGGIVLSAILNKQRTPKPIVLLHGLFAALALAIVIVYIMKGHYDHILLASAITLCVAALGGLLLFSIDIFTKKPPKIMAIMHPILAVSGVLILIAYMVLRQP